MATVTLYTRSGCHLCDVAHADLEALRVSIDFDLETIDVDGDPELVACFGDTVPVIHVDGRIACKVRVDVDVMRRRLLG